MAASKLKSVSALTSDMPAFQNVLRAQMSASYQDRIPVVTQENLAQTAVAVLENPVYANEYLSALVDRIFTPTFTNTLSTISLPSSSAGSWSMAVLWKKSALTLSTRRCMILRQRKLRFGNATFRRYRPFSTRSTAKTSTRSRWKMNCCGVRLWTAMP